MKEFVWKNLGNNSETRGIFFNLLQSSTTIHYGMVFGFWEPSIVLHGLVQSELWMITRGLRTWTQNLKGSNNAGQWWITPKQFRAGTWFWRESLCAIASALDYVLGIMYWIVRLDWLCIPLAAKPSIGIFGGFKKDEVIFKNSAPREFEP